MNDLSRIISVGVGPIIVISACGLLCLALYNRLATIVMRVRQYQREFLNEQIAHRQRPAKGDDLMLVRHQEFTGMLRVQIDRMSRRAFLIRRAVLCLLLTVLLLTLCALMLGLSVVLPTLVGIAAAFFTLALLSLATGIVFALMEITQALDPMLLEASFVTSFSGMLEDFDASTLLPPDADTAP